VTLNIDHDGEDNFMSIVFTDSKLIISVVAPGHAGMYQCIAVNHVGMDYVSIRLSVKPNGTKGRKVNDVQNIAPDCKWSVSVFVADYKRVFVLGRS